MTNPREKGKRGERSVCRKLTTWAGRKFTRTAYSRGRGTNTPDLETPEGFRPVIEVKNREGWSWDATLQGQGPVWEWWEQARRQAGERVPWLIVTRNRQPEWLMMPATAAILRGVLAPTFSITGPQVFVFRLDYFLECSEYERWAQ